MTAIATALWLLAVWAVVCPLLVPLDEGDLVPLVAVAVPAALVAGGLAGASARRPGSVARRALHAARRAVLAASAAAVAGTLGAVVLGGGGGIVPSLCLGAAALGGALSSGVVAGLAAFLEGRGATGRGLGYQRTIVSAMGLLVGAAWLFAGAHTVAAADAGAREEAHAAATDLAGLGVLALRTTAATPASVAAALAPQGGFAVVFDEGNHPLAAAGVDDPERVVVAPEGCLADHRSLPCAMRSLDDGRHVVVGSPAGPAARELAELAGGLGGAVLLATLLLAVAVGRATAGELERTTASLARLQSRGWGLERPIGVGTWDELGDLNVAVGTQRARLEAELHATAASLQRASEADRQQGNFLTMVGAELRAPLEAVEAHALAIAAAGRLSGEQTRDLELIQKGVKELHALIDSVLGLSAEDPTLRPGEAPLKLGEVDLLALGREVARAQRPLVEARKVRLTVEAAGEVPPVRGDAQRLRQVLTNLITNAVKFTEEGRVAVEVRQEGERVAVSVRDDGPGIAPEVIPRLFREFEQGAGAPSPVRGTGLGLAICKRLVEAHGGTIAVESVLGAGSTFRIALPLDGPPETVETERRAAGGEKR